MAGAGAGGDRSHWVQSGSREQWMLGPTSFLLFVRCRTPAWGMMPPTVTVNLPASVKLI